jgi:hypothetical protein
MTNLALLPTTKCCNRCKQYLPFSLFNTNNARKDKLSSHCKECDRISQERIRKKNYQQRLKQDRKYREQKKKSFDQRLQALLNSSKQRATLKKLEHDITLQDVKELYPIDGCCPVFGFKLEFGNAGFREHSPSIDRIDSSKGYTKDNIQILSWKANRIKGYATVEDLEAVLAYLKQGE